MNARLRHPLGWLLNSVQYRAAREVAIWLKSNAYQREHRYNRLHAILLWLGNLPLFGATTFGIIEIVVVILAVNLHWRMPQWGLGEIDSYSGILSHFMAIWTVQATVAVLTFPIVVSLVTFLIGTKESGGRRQQVYMSDSCAMLIAISSLALVLAMGIQDLFLLKRDRQILQWMLFPDDIWFLFNLAGTIYFLYRSFLFVLPASRRRIVMRHAVTVMWPQEAFHLNKNFALMASSGDKELMPHGNNIIYFGSLWNSLGELAVWRQFPTRRFLNDVYLRPIDWAVALWRRNSGNSSGADKRERAFREPEPRLSFPVSFDIGYTGKTQLCRAIGSKKPGFLARLLILLSFKFARQSPEEEHESVEKYVAEMQSDILDALNARHYQQFEERYEALIDFLGNILHGSEYTGDGGQKGNFALVPWSTSMIGGPLYRRWFRAHIQIAEACIPTLKDNPDYFQFMCYVPTRLLYRTRNLAHVDFAKDVISLGLTVFLQLGAWWTRTVEEQGVVEHGRCNPANLRPPYYSRYAETLNDFIGAYEGLRNYQLLIRDDAPQEDWSAVQNTIQLNTTHLEQILLMMSSAVGRGDTSGAHAAVDMLQRWADQMHQHMRGTEFSMYRGWLITVNDVTRKSREELETVAASADRFQEYKGHESTVAIAIALHNLWTDSLCVAVYTLLQWGVGCKCTDSVPAKLAGYLVRGQPITNSGTPSGPLTGVRNRTELLQAIIRQQSSESWSGDATYNGLLSGFYEQIQRINDPPMVSGRPYSSFGARDLNSTRDGQLLFLMMLSGNAWHPEVEFQEYVSGLVAADNEIARSLHTYFKSLVERVGSSDFDKYKDVFNCTRNTLNAVDFGSIRDELKVALERFTKLFDQNLDAAVIDAEIDPERLATVASYAASDGFSKKDGVAPLTLFKEVGYSESVSHEFTLTINGVEKGEFVRPLRKQLAANEKEWYAQSIRERVSVSIMQEVVRRLQFKLVDASAPELYWAEFKRTVSELRDQRLTPMLLLENRVVPRWVWDWALVHRVNEVYVPEDLRVVKDPSHREEAGYEVTFNDVPVYQVPLPSGSSIILPAEIFDKITLRTYAGHGCIKPGWQPVSDKPTKIDLILKWGHDIEFDTNLRGLATRLMYGQKIAEE